MRKSKEEIKEEVKVVVVVVVEVEVEVVVVGVDEVKEDSICRRLSDFGVGYETMIVERSKRWPKGS